MKRNGFITPDRIRGYPAVVLAVMVLFVVYRHLAGSSLLNEPPETLGGDFLSFYTGGSFVLNGTSAGLSDPSAQLAFQRALLHASQGGTAVWVSPPFFAWFFAPLAKLPYPLAFSAFVLFSALLATASLWVLQRALEMRHSLGRMSWVALQYFPTVWWLINGQTTGIWLSLFVGVFVLLRRRRDALAGLLLGLFACKPTLALGLGVALLVARRFRTLLFAACSAGGLVGLGFATLPDAMQRYLHQGSSLLSLVRAENYPSAGLHGSVEFGTLLLDGVSRRLGLLLGGSVFVGLLGLIASFWWRQSWRPASPEWDWRMAATLALGVIASPHLYGYDLTLLLLPLFIAVARCPSGGTLPLDDGPLLRATAWVWALGLGGPVLSFLQQGAARASFGFPMALQFGVLAILVWGLRASRMATQSVSTQE